MIGILLTITILKDGITSFAIRGYLPLLAAARSFRPRQLAASCRKNPRTATCRNLPLLAASCRARLLAATCCK